MAIDTIDTEAMARSAEEAARFLKTIGNPKRMLILCYLVNCERNVMELEQLLDVRQSSISQELAQLRRNGMVSTRAAAKKHLLPDQRSQGRSDHRRRPQGILRQIAWFGPRRNRPIVSRTSRIRFQHRQSRPSIGLSDRNGPSFVPKQPMEDAHETGIWPGRSRARRRGPDRRPAGRRSGGIVRPQSGPCPASAVTARPAKARTRSLRSMARPRLLSPSR